MLDPVMLLSLALASALVAPELDAPPPGPAPSSTTVVAPAPGPAPAPAATEPAPVDTVVVTTTTTTTTTTAPIIVDAPAPVVITTAPPPPPLVSPPAPTWGPVRPSPPLPPDPARTQESIRKFRRGGVGVFLVGGLGMAGALGLQAARAQGLRRCINSSGPDSNACVESDVMEGALSRYSALGMAMFVTGSAGAGMMFGNAAATRDVQLRGGSPRSRGGAKLLGIVAIGASAAWMIGGNYTLLRHEAGCDGDPGCIAKYRPLRWAVNDGAVLGIGAGAGLLGWAIAYEKQGKALFKLRAAPSIGARQTGVSVSMSF